MSGGGETSLEEGFTVATNGVIAAAILAATRRLVVVAPALSVEVAAAVCDRWASLDPEAVTVVLDSDPEVYRLGYGDSAALDALQRTAHEVGGILRHQPGLRIAVIIAEEQTMGYAPTPRLVEGQNTTGGANALCLGRPPVSVAEAVDLGSAAGQKIGRTRLDAQHIERIASDLTKNPPQKFDLARRVRVFNAFIEFVELEVLGTQLSRRTVTIPNHLLAVADATTREQLHATFRLVPTDDGLSGAAIERDRRLLERRFLHEIPRYGTVVLRRNKDEFVKQLESLVSTVNRFATDVKAGIEAAMLKNREHLINTFMPALKERPPQDWIPTNGVAPDEATMRRYLEEDLRSAFGTAERLIRGMKVQCRFKGVTIEMLSDPKFVAAATKAIPELERFHHEFEAAKASISTTEGSANNEPTSR